MKYLLFAVLAIIIVLVIFAIIKRNEIVEWLKRPATIAYIKMLCRQAEEFITGTKKGQERLLWVCRMVVNYAPETIRKFITAEMLAKVVTMIFESIAVQMADGTTKAV